MGDDHERLLAAYAPLRRFASAVGPPGVEPDDLVQEAFVRALRRGLSEVGDLDAYLRRAVLNLASNERRSWSRRQRAFGRHGVTDDDMDAPPTAVDVAELLALPADVRACLWLAEVEGWSYAEIGRLVGCSEGAARMRASRGRQALRDRLASEGGEA